MEILFKSLYLNSMKRLPILILLIIGAFAANAQIKEYPQSPYDFHKGYSIKNDSLAGIPNFKEPQGLAATNPFATNLTIKVGTNLVDDIPILHPEMEGYGMPVKEPAKNIDQSLIISPVPTKENDH
ncbi:hypothetical protein [Marinoscillum pacificum]|uniref:hypothetical protein n=1 Tax=Marinoscillum pacificum TaxID=392723 RepID=UPI0021576EE0|nr:hypothetical protein [Marinoscillum pacificum]